MPSSVSGAYKLQLATLDGELAVAPRGADVFKYVPVVVGASGVKGGLMGGVSLTLTAAGSAGFNTTSPELNQVGVRGRCGAMAPGVLGTDGCEALCAAGAVPVLLVWHGIVWCAHVKKTLVIK